VQLQLMTATVKLFLKKPVEKPQQLIQLVLTYATQVGGGEARARVGDGQGRWAGRRWAGQARKLGWCSCSRAGMS